MDSPFKLILLRVVHQSVKKSVSDGRVSYDLVQRSTGSWLVMMVEAEPCRVLDHLEGDFLVHYQSMRVKSKVVKDEDRRPGEPREHPRVTPVRPCHGQGCSRALGS